MSTRKKKEPTPKKQCSSCGKDKATTFFFKVDSPLFPDGMINTCRDCVRAQVDVNDMEQVISFLRQIDKPFNQKYWDEATKSKNHPLGEYIRKINSLNQVKNKSFDDSQAVGIGTALDVQASQLSEKIEREDGEIIEYSDSLVSRWGIGYQKHEYLRLEKYYQDMMMSYEVKETNHKHMLKQLAKLSVEADNALARKDFTQYGKINKEYDILLKSAGMRPVDKKSGSEATGLFSFSQVWAEIEKEGFIPPKLVKFKKDDIDYMLMYYQQFVERLVDKPVTTEPDTEWRDEVIDYEPEEEE
ncbi:putative small terminase [Bacillus phage Izhevsk]|uniref:Putative small terminase n=1 Tax=Bacillus phage Izhevsk TaxID=2724322 RepID=A0A6H0X6F9_9CAUD|nr:putative small terminase [Bacillus phage Izhevsk]QIW89904.1 putative small terminase [Bacillus phage Izhevsk]